MAANIVESGKKKVTATITVIQPWETEKLAAYRKAQEEKAKLNDRKSS